jgi:hypothetical protein
MISGERSSSLSSTSRASAGRNYSHEVWRAAGFVSCAASGCFRLQVSIVYEREGDRLQYVEA